MRRTNYGPALREFFGENRRLLLFLLLFVTGTVLGVVVFMMTHEQLADDLLLMFGQHAGISGFQEGIAVLCASCQMCIRDRSGRGHRTAAFRHISDDPGCHKAKSTL